MSRQPWRRPPYVELPSDRTLDAFMRSFTPNDAAMIRVREGRNTHLTYTPEALADALATSKENKQ